MNTVTSAVVSERSQLLSRLNDYAQLTKLRITCLIVVTAWCGFFFGARKAGLPVAGAALWHALLGIAAVASGTAALNEVLECRIDGKMRRTASRPLPAGRMSLAAGTLVGVVLSVGGSAYLVLFTNWLTGCLALLTSVVYLFGYTPLKPISPVCLVTGAIPGAMPGVLGWTAACNRLDWGALVLFGILFLWQFPHFLAIAWIYREDYARGGIRMLPAVQPDGRSTALRIVLYTVALLLVSLLPVMFAMTGAAYLAGAVLLGLMFLFFAVRMMTGGMAMSEVTSRLRARQLFQCSIVYLPLLFALMMSDAVR